MICYYSYNCNGKFLFCILDVLFFCKIKEVVNFGMSSIDF